MRNWTLLFLAVLLAGCSRTKTPEPSSSRPLVAIDPATVSSVTGVVTFDGAPPKPQPIDMSQDPACVMGKTQPNFGEAYSIANGRVQNVYVYIKDGLGNYSYPLPPPATLDQHGCRYSPHVLGLMAGQTLRILNSDSTLHNIHSASLINPAWNISQMPKGDPLERIFTKPELMIPVMCNQHPWMKMFLNVSTHPFFAVTDKDGRFSIKGLPPGDYTLAAVHEKLGKKIVHIHVAAKEAKVADFRFTAADEK